MKGERKMLKSLKNFLLTKVLTEGFLVDVAKQVIILAVMFIATAVVAHAEDAGPSDVWFKNAGRVMLTFGAFFLVGGAILGRAGVIANVFNPDNRGGLGNLLPVIGIFLLALWVYLDTLNGWTKLGQLMGVIDWFTPGGG